MNLIKRLVSEGHDVVSLDDYSTGFEKMKLKDVITLTDIESLEYWKGEGFDLCYHITKQSRVQPSFKTQLIVLE